MHENIPDSVIETIRNKKDILAQMRELCDMRSIVQVHKMGDSSRAFVSRFQEVHDSGDILVDPLMPPDGECYLQGADDIIASYALNDNKYEFDTQLVDLVTDGKSAIRLSRPLNLRRLQLRRYYRIRFAEESSLPVSLMRHGTDALSLKGKVIDLGEGGMGSNVDFSEGLEVGMPIDKLLFALPNGYTVYAPATVRNVFPLRNAEGDIVCYRCGLQFGELEGRQRRTLAEFIFKKRCEQIRRNTPSL